MRSPVVATVLRGSRQRDPYRDARSSGLLSSSVLCISLCILLVVLLGSLGFRMNPSVGLKARDLNGPWHRPNPSEVQSRGFLRAFVTAQRNCCDDDGERLSLSSLVYWNILSFIFCDYFVICRRLIGAFHRSLLILLFRPLSSLNKPSRSSRGLSMMCRIAYHRGSMGCWLPNAVSPTLGRYWQM